MKDSVTRGVWIAFAALCTLSASFWLFRPAVDEVWLFTTAIAFTLISFAAAAALLLLWVRRGNSREGIYPIAAGDRINASVTALAAAGVFAAPALLLGQNRHLANSSIATAALSLTPMAAGVTVAVLRGRDLQASLGPSALAAAGVLIFLPVAEPTSISGLAGFALCVCVAVLLGVSIVFCNAALRRTPIFQAVLLTASTNAAFFWIDIMFRHGRTMQFPALTSDLFLLVLFETASASLALWLLQTMRPIAYATRYLWAPLIAATEGYIVLHPPLSWRTVCGALMIASGGILLLRERDDLPDEVLRLR